MDVVLSRGWVADENRGTFLSAGLVLQRPKACATLKKTVCAGLNEFWGGRRAACGIAAPRGMAYRPGWGKVLVEGHGNEEHGIDADG
jgi:hypothetical protein